MHIQTVSISTAIGPMLRGSSGFDKDLRCRNPTLSYTQRLEQKVAQLEDALAESEREVIEVRVKHAANNDSPLEPRGSHSEVSHAGTTSSDEGRLPLDDSISLFPLPGGIRTFALEQRQVAEELAAGKESLVISAWRERAYERLADTPVCQVNRSA